MELIKPLKLNNTSLINDNSTVTSLDSFRIKATDKIPSNVYVAKINQTKKFSRKNISAWLGKAKAKKTYAMTMLGSSLISGIDLYDIFYSYKKNKLVWIDTEQSPADAQKVAIRINKLVGNAENLFLYGLRPLSPNKRIEMIDKAIKQHKPDILIIDGVRDLVWNINDPVESTTVVTMIMKWSYDYDMHIAAVIHITKDGKARGHIGTEIENKSETVIRVTRDELDINISTIEEVFGRGKGFEPFKFYVNKEGLPEVGGVDLGNSFGGNDDDDTPF